MKYLILLLTLIVSVACGETIPVERADFIRLLNEAESNGINTMFYNDLSGDFKLHYYKLTSHRIETLKGTRVEFVLGLYQKGNRYTSKDDTLLIEFDFDYDDNNRETFTEYLETRDRLDKIGTALKYTGIGAGALTLGIILGKLL